MKIIVGLLFLFSFVGAWANFKPFDVGIHYHNSYLLTFNPQEGIVLNRTISFIRKLIQDRAPSHISLEIPITLLPDNQLAWNVKTEYNGFANCLESIVSYIHNHGLSTSLKFSFIDQRGKRVTLPSSYAPSLLSLFRTFAREAGKKEVDEIVITGLSPLLVTPNQRLPLEKLFQEIRFVFKKGTVRFGFVGKEDWSDTHLLLSSEIKEKINGESIDLDEKINSVEQKENLKIQIKHWREEGILVYLWGDHPFDGEIVEGVFQNLPIISFPPLTNNQMGYHRSFLFNQLWEHPSNEESFFLPFVELELPMKWVRNITLLIHLKYSPQRGFHYGASVDGGDERGYSVMTHFAHENRSTMTFKVNPPHEKISIPSDSKLKARFLDSYMKALLYFSRIGHKASADEIVLGTGIAHWGCEDHEWFNTLIHQVKKRFPLGRLRLDFRGAEDLQENRHCIKDFENQFSILGVDLPANSDPEIALKLSQEGFLLSRVTFNGPWDSQNSQGLLFLNRLPKGSWFTLGTVYPGIPILDETESIRGKRWMQSIRSWYSQDF